MTSAKWKTLGVLLVGNLVWIFANGRWRVDALAWVFPFLILLFLHQNKLWRGILLLYVVNYLVQIVAWQGMIPIPGAGYYLVLLGITVCYVLPFGLDRWLRPKIRGFKQTLILPMAAVTCDFLNATLSPYGTNGNLAYSQYDFPQFLQIMALTGIWGISFLLYWFGSILYYIFVNRANLRTVRRHLVASGLIYALVMAYGFLRFGLDDESNRVRVVSFTAPLQELWDSFGELGVDLTRDEPLVPAAAELLNRYQDAYFALAESLVDGTTQIVMSSEANLPVEKEYEAKTKERLARFSRENEVVSVHGVVVYAKGEALSENKILAFDKQGKEIPEYYKSFIVPGDANIRKGKSHQTLNLESGKAGLAICFDLDFPQWAQEYGRQEVAMVLSPASDWREIDPYHTEMAVFRAIENGFSLVRQTNKGLSIAVDGRRRIHAKADFFAKKPHTMIVDIPVSKLGAYYPHTSDAVAWLCLIGIIYFIFQKKPVV